MRALSRTWCSRTDVRTRSGYRRSRRAHEGCQRLERRVSLFHVSASGDFRLTREKTRAIVISHDETFIRSVCKELIVCADGKADKFYGDVSEYKKLILSKRKDKPT